MNEKLQGLLKSYLTKYYTRVIENNPYEEFKKFYLEHKNLYDNLNPISAIANIIDMRLLNRKKIVDKYDEYYSYANNIQGVSDLKNIHKNIMDTEHSSNMLDLEDNLDWFNYYYFLLYLILTSSYPIIKIDTLEKYENMIRHYSKGYLNEQVKYYFRGQSDSKWNIIPSCLRNFDLEKTQIFDYDQLIDKYQSISVFDKYKKIIDTSAEAYPMISFFQHSISYSPLVDFTSKLEIASFFALHNISSINDFFNKDSAIFELDIRNGNSDLYSINNMNLEDMKIGIYKDGVRTYKDYAFMYKNMGRLFGTDAKTTFSFNRTNDRMRYQSGAFIFFDDYIIENMDSTIITIRTGQPIVKIVIDKSIKKAILDYLNINYPDYKLRYLMNPYLRFEESN